jgi:hypothetical protein
LEYSTTGSVSLLVINLVGFVVKPLQAVTLPSEAIVTLQPNKNDVQKNMFFQQFQPHHLSISHKQEIV